MFSPVVCFVPRSIPQVFEFHLSGRTIRAHCRIAPGGHGAVSLLLDDEEQIEDALPEPEQEGALESPAGETVPCDPGIGGLGPLPDAGPDEAEVVEGVRSEAETKAREDFAFDVGIMLSGARGILDDLQHAAEVAIKDTVTSGRLQVQREGLAVSVAWNSDGATLTVQGAILAEEEG